MHEKHLKLLTENKYYLIYSKRTNRPYLNVNNAGFMFESRLEADAFIKEMKDDLMRKNEPQQNTKDVISLFYSCGMEKVFLKTSSSKDLVEVPVCKEDTKGVYYNCILTRSIIQLKQTKKKKYLRDMYKLKFIIPIMIKKRKKKEYHQLHYIYATVKKDMKYYVFFSTLQEFEKWNEKQNEVWKPLEVLMPAVKSIRGDNPVLINPLTDKLILTGQQINDMEEKYTKKTTSSSSNDTGEKRNEKESSNKRSNRQSSGQEHSK